MSAHYREKRRPYNAAMSPPHPTAWQSVSSALKRAGRDLFTARMLALVLLPMCVALLVWGGLAWWQGAAWQAHVTALLAATPLHTFASWAGADWLLTYGALFLVILLWLPAVYVTALLITSLALMPFIVGQVGARTHAGLARRQGGTFSGSLMNGLYASTVYLVAWLLTLPLWLLGPLGLLMSIWLNTWLNRRLFLYDALAEHADADELRRLRRADAGPVLGLSALLSLLHMVPLAGLLAPVYMGLAFAHYGLERLRLLRGSAS